jgi:hypothetical protein
MPEINPDDRYLNMTPEELAALSPEDFAEAGYAFNRRVRAEEDAGKSNYIERQLLKLNGYKPEDDELDLLGADYHKVDHAELARRTEESREQLRKQLMAEAEAEREQAANEAANQFVREHDEFIPCPENLAAFTSYLDAKKLDVRSVEDLEIVYAELRKQNALKLDPEKLAEERAAKRNARFVAEALRESRATEATDLSNLSPEDAGRRYTEWAANEKQLQLRRSGLSTK